MFSQTLDSGVRQIWAQIMPGHVRDACPQEAYSTPRLLSFSSVNSESWSSSSSNCNYSVNSNFSKIFPFLVIIHSHFRTWKSPERILSFKAKYYSNVFPFDFCFCVLCVYVLRKWVLSMALTFSQAFHRQGLVSPFSPIQ